MKPDTLLLISGLIGETELSSGAVDLLKHASSAFLRAGGTVSLSEYENLSTESLVALRAAYDSLQDDLAHRVAEHLAEAVTGAVDAMRADQEAAQVQAAAEALADSVGGAK